uniref:Replication restart protein PriA n=1 Tax=Candidatus Kentrum sp. MB TaxID=2138164 RepID=A0A450XDI1_9GAMM|nr:MAG: replication restart DNA helicase PriA [Candidatus Kentron sp. MB]
MQSTILRVAIPSPLRRLFDYLPPEKGDCVPRPGMRVRVPFGRVTRMGVIMEVADHSDIAPERLKPVSEILDSEPLLPADTMALLRWASGYYHYPLGEAMSGALPALLRKGGAARAEGPRWWRVTAEGKGHTGDELSRAPRQARLFAAIGAHPNGIADRELDPIHGNRTAALRALEKKGWIASLSSPCWEAVEIPTVIAGPIPESAQTAAIEAITAARDGFAAFLLDGVTSSGKTEVYLSVIREVVSRNRQALVLIPEIGLTPQTVARFRKRIATPVVVLHSGLSDSERLCGWLAARNGEAGVVIGTRSAVLAPLRRPGIFIVDEEHDLSYKQQDRFRYSARDVAVYRARQVGVPLVLGSATPSLESLYNVELARYRRLTLPKRARGALHPDYRIVDVRRKPFRDGLSPALLQAIEERIAEGEQVLLFINRRGYAPVYLCHACGWIANCERCDAHLVYHARHVARPDARLNEQRSDARVDEKGRAPREGCLRCHHCGAQYPITIRCPSCGGEELRALGIGVQRVAEALAAHFPKARIVRVDRDSVRRKGSLEKILSAVAAEAVDILVGTQMLAKGHHFPNVTLVGIVDADSGLFGADFRAGERMAQTMVQVAGRAGRGERPGQVLIQTHHPEHPLLQALVREGYHHFAQTALEERHEATLPPYCYLALVRVESVAQEIGMAFLGEARALATSVAQSLTEVGLEIRGPIPAPMERREGRYHAQLLLEAGNRGILHRFLNHWIPKVEGLKSARRVRWSLDVDPQEMF